jgi:hypothetical protein
MSKRYPISRMSKFYDELDFSLENDMAREWFEGDLNMVVVLFEVEKYESTTDDLYGESSSSQLKFKAPKELRVRLQIDEPKTGSYTEGYNRYEEYGDLTFTVFVDHLKELGAEIHYGDYIGYVDREDNIKYFTVYDDGNIYSDNSHTRLGYKGYYRTVKCKVADFDEINPNIMPI